MIFISGPECRSTIAEDETTTSKGPSRVPLSEIPKCRSCNGTGRASSTPMISVHIQTEPLLNVWCNLDNETKKTFAKKSTGKRPVKTKSQYICKKVNKTKKKINNYQCDADQSLPDVSLDNSNSKPSPCGLDDPLPGKTERKSLRRLKKVSYCELSTSVKSEQEHFSGIEMDVSKTTSNKLSPVKDKSLLKENRVSNYIDKIIASNNVILECNKEELEDSRVESQAERLHYDKSVLDIASNNDLVEPAKEDSEVLEELQDVDSPAERQDDARSDLDTEKCDLLKEVNHTDDFKQRLVTKRKYPPQKRKPGSCEICGKHYHNAYLLKDHLILHENKNAFQCDICQKNLANSKILKQHKKAHTEGSVWTCGVCEEKFMHKSDIAAHRHSVHKDINTTYEGKTLIAKHIPKLKRIRKKSPGFCEICGKYYSDFYLLKNHMILHTNKDAFQCEICHLNLSSPKILKGHRKSHFNKGSLKQNQVGVICETCGKPFSNKRVLRLHMEKNGCHGSLVDSPKLFECSECPRTFETELGFRIHYSQIHQIRLDLNKGNSLLNTSLCYSVRGIRKKRGEKRYPCEYCPKSFSNSFERENHRNRHLGLQPYKCSFCPKAFHSNSARRGHEAFHKDKRFTCDVCQAKFVRRYALHVHARIHTGEKPHNCSVCGMRFRQIGDRNKHQRRHSEKINMNTQVIDSHNKSLGEIKDFKYF